MPSTLVCRTTFHLMAPPRSEAPMQLMFPQPGPMGMAVVAAVVYAA